MSDKPPQDQKKIQVFYQNSPLHRTIFAGGAWAGVSATGLLQLGLFNDLRAMPEMVVLEVENDTFGTELEKIEKRGVVREVEATVLIPLEVAKSLMSLMQQMIDQIEALNAAQQSRTEHALVEKE